MQQFPGNGNTLCLTFAESVALFAQFGIEAIRQVTNGIFIFLSLYLFNYLQISL